MATTLETIRRIDEQIGRSDAAICHIDSLDSFGRGAIIRFTVDDHRLIDENQEVPDTAIVSFQVAYAVSIHKA